VAALGNGFPNTGVPCQRRQRAKSLLAGSVPARVCISSAAQSIHPTRCNRGSRLT